MLADGEQMSSFILNFTLILFSSLITGSFFANSVKLTSIRVYIGFILNVTIVSIIYIITPRSIDLTTNSILLILIFVELSLLVILLFKKRITYIRTDYFEFFSLFAITGILIWLTGPFVRYHSSPDNHGFGITYSYMAENFSLNHLKFAFKNATGLEESIFLGQATPLLTSTWHILDWNLRFASDMVLQVGRIGIPAYGAVFKIDSNIVDNFTSFVTVMNVMGIWLLATFVLLLSRKLNEILLFITKQKNSVKASGSLSGKGITNDSNELIMRISDFTKILVLSFSGWLLVFFVEGTTTQIWCLINLLFALYCLLDFNSENVNEINYFRLSSSTQIKLALNSVASGLIYPQGFIFYFIITFFVATLIFTINRAATFTFIRSMIFPILAILPLTFFLIKDTFVSIIGNFLKGAPNMPYQVGPIPIWDVAPLLNNKMEITKVNGPGQGFEPIYNTATPGINAIIFLLFILLVSMLHLVFKHKTFKICWFYLMPIILLVMPLRQLINSSTTWFPYQYFRNLSFVYGIGLPFILAIASFQLSAILVKVRKYRLLVATLVIMFASISLIQTINFLSGFLNVSKPMSIIDERIAKNVIQSESNKLYVSDAPNQEFLTLAMYGKFNMLTDGWEPELLPEVDGKSFEVYKVVWKKEKVDLVLLGKVQTNSPIRGMITYDEFIDLINNR